jgi:hypothetical protein
MDSTQCNLGKFLVVPTFVARRLQVRKDARDPSGESWDYLPRRLSCNFEEMTTSTPFRDLFLTTNLRQGATATISLCVFKT